MKPLNDFLNKHWVKVSATILVVGALVYKFGAPKPEERKTLRRKPKNAASN